MNEKDIDNLIKKAMEDEGKLPEGLSMRLEQYIDNLENDNKKQTSIGRMWVWAGGIAASLLLGLALIQFDGNDRQQEVMIADTFTNPQDAATTAEKTLCFISTKLNKGLDKANSADRHIKKINNIFNSINDTKTNQQ